jgi:hypothetical protein
VVNNPEALFSVVDPQIGNGYQARPGFDLGMRRDFINQLCKLSKVCTNLYRLSTCQINPLVVTGQEYAGVDLSAFRRQCPLPHL